MAHPQRNPLVLSCLLVSSLVQAVPIIPKWVNASVSAVTPPAGNATTSYGSPLIPGATNYSVPYANPFGPACAKYPQPSRWSEQFSFDLSDGSPVVESFTYADPMLFLDDQGEPHPVLRDLGFSGVLNGKVIWTFGDTLIGTPDSNIFTADDSISITPDLRRPFLAKDTAMNGSAVSPLIPLNAEEVAGGGYVHFAFGGTNIIETRPGVGLIYYLINNRAAGDLNGDSSKILGAGAAEVTLDDRDRPVVRRFGNSLWSSVEPAWGDVGIALDGRDDNIYVYGHGPPGTPLSSFTYLCRVNRDSAADVTAYEYYDNSTSTWGTQRLGDGTNGTIVITQEMAIFGFREMNQAAPFWSHWLHKWTFIHGNSYGTSPVLLKTADNLEGPWTTHDQIADSKPDIPVGNNLRYAIMGHPEFDNSGRTVVVTWTRANRIYGGVIVWAPPI